MADYLIIVLAVKKQGVNPLHFHQIIFLWTN